MRRSLHRVNARKTEPAAKEWRPLEKVLKRRKFYSSYAEMYADIAGSERVTEVSKTTEPTPRREPMTCPCCKGRGSIPSDYERMNPYTGYIQKDPDRPCLYCMGKGVA